MKAVFIGFDNKQDVESTWQITIPRKTEILLAASEDENYSAHAFVLLRQDGKLYEVNDSHCSCHGFENWDMEETSIGALRMRQFTYWENGQTLHAQLNSILDKLEKQAAKKAA